MKPRLFKADAITLAFSALLGITAIWLLVDQFIGATNPLEDRLFSFALGIFLGNLIRLMSVSSRSADQAP